MCSVLFVRSLLILKIHLLYEKGIFGNQPKFLFFGGV